MADTRIAFTKMHGLGNDFVVIDNIQEKISLSALPLLQIADRHLGIGCDQILIIEPSSTADFYCRILNADGSEAEQCGNGLRCIARYVHENKLTELTKFSIATVAGVFPVEIIDYDNIRITIPVPDINSTSLSLMIHENSKTVAGHSLLLGNPHFIVAVETANEAIAGNLGPKLTNHTEFPNGANIGFVETIDPSHIRLCTFERGSGLTNACGSNACAAVAAGVLQGELSNQVDVEFKYGKLNIEWHGKGRPIVMSGPASLTFHGELNLK